MVYTVYNNNVHNTYVSPYSTQQVSNTYDYTENVNGAYILGNYHDLATNYNTGVQEIALQNLRLRSLPRSTLQNLLFLDRPIQMRPRDDQIIRLNDCRLGPCLI